LGREKVRKGSGEGKKGKKKKGREKLCY